MPPPRPQTIGHFRIAAKLGEGGMGEVWRATDTKLNREVAIKLLPSAFAADPMRLGRFRREAQVLAALNHPNIAHLYGVEEQALIMEMVEGPTLADRIAQGDLTYEESLELAGQIADGLDYAHEKGIIHRDLKPANIKITPEGRIKILDFGLAKAMTAEGFEEAAAEASTLSSPATLAGTVLGTAAYMAPEQAKGKPVDRRADIWAFGAVLYEMLSGKRTFAGEDVAETLAAVLTREPDCAGLPEPARSVVERCLKKDPKQRWGWIGDAVCALRTPPAASPTAAKRGMPFLKGAAWLGLALLVGAVAWWLTQPAATELHFSAVTTYAGVQAQPTFSPDGRSVAFISNRDGHYNVYVVVVHGGGAVEVTHDENLKAAPAWSPDGTTLAYARLNGSGIWDIWEIPALGGQPRRIILNATDPTWSADSDSLLYTNQTDGSLWMANASGENAHRVVAAPAGYMATQPRISPDGRSVAYILRSTVGGPYGELAVAEMASGSMRQITNDGALALSPAWAPDSKNIYFASSRGGTLNIWEIGASGRGLHQITAGAGDDADLDVSADGKRIVFGTMRVDIGLDRWDLQASPGERNPVPLTTDPARNAFAPAYSPDGKHLAYFTNLKGVENETVVVADTDGDNAVQVVQDSHADVFPCWTPDSQQILYEAADNHPFLKEVAISGGAPRSLAAADGVTACDVNGEGEVLWVRDAGEVEALHPATGKSDPLFRLPPGGSSPMWGPDPHSVVYLRAPEREGDAAAGVWINDLRSPPRQIFHGLATDMAVADGDVYILAVRPDMSTDLWKVQPDGKTPTRLDVVVPALYDLNYFRLQPQNQFAVSHDGRFVAFQTQTVLQENIGMIELPR